MVIVQNALRNKQRKKYMAKKTKQIEGTPMESLQGPRYDVSKMKAVRLVTLPTWKWEDGQTKYFRIESAIREGRAIDKKAAKEADVKVSGKEQKMAPARIMQVTDLQTGTRCEMVVGEVLESNLVENYKDDSYVSKCFQVTRSKVEGKRYKNYSLIEIDPAGAVID